MKEKKRLDLLVKERYPDLSRQQIHSYIMQGKVVSNNKLLLKPGVLVSIDEPLELRVQAERFVSRAGYKLEHALAHFSIDPTGLVALDAGLSTGGFSDCLLQAGAQKIYGVDVGYGQVHEKMRHDPRMVIRERTNLRTLTVLPEQVDIVTLDLSFISVLKVMQAINALIKPGGKLVVLIKPQFEAGRAQVSRGGIVKDPAVHQQVIETVTQGIVSEGYELKGVTESPLTGTQGNKEFLAYFIRKHD